MNNNMQQQEENKATFQSNATSNECNRSSSSSSSTVFNPQQQQYQAHQPLSRFHSETSSASLLLHSTIPSSIQTTRLINSTTATPFPSFLASSTSSPFSLTPSPSSSSSSASPISPSHCFVLPHAFSPTTTTANLVNNTFVQNSTLSQPIAGNSSNNTSPASPVPTSNNGSAEKKKSQMTRKEKSLGALAERFIDLCSKRSQTVKPLEIKLEEAAKELDVEKRRVYDIVNVLESMEVMQKRGVSLYTWNGFDQLSASFSALRVKAFNDSLLYQSIKQLEDNEDNNAVRRCLREFAVNIQNQKSDSSSEAKKKEKSLWLLSQKFLQLFLITQSSVLTHDQAVEILIKNYHSITTDSGLRTKIRRLYDIVNILSSLNVVVKVSANDFRKQHTFKWVGQDLKTFGQTKPNLTAIANTVPSTQPDSQLVSSIISPSKRVPLKKRKRRPSFKQSSSSHSEELSITPPKDNDDVDDKNDKENTRQTTGYVSPTDRSGLHFQFHSPPAKRNRQADRSETRDATQGKRTDLPIAQLFASDVQSQPLSNATSRILNQSFSGTTKFAIISSDRVAPKQNVAANNISTSPTTITPPTQQAKKSSPKITFKVIDKSTPSPPNSAQTQISSQTSPASPLLTPSQLVLPPYLQVQSNNNNKSQVFQIGSTGSLKVHCPDDIQMQQLKTIQPIFVPIYVPVSIQPPANPQANRDETKQP